MSEIAAALLQTWFGDWNDHTPTPDPCPQLQLWWKKDPAVDAMLRDRFGEANAAARRGDLNHWTESPRGTLALVILLDQVSRNIHRDTADMFTADKRARAVAYAAIAHGDDMQLVPIERYFLYMPLMHSEDPADHEESLHRFGQLVEATRGLARADNYENALKYARMHADIIARFGRYPHRNALLGRESTPEERAFLQQPGSSF